MQTKRHDQLEEIKERRRQSGLIVSLSLSILVLFRLNIGDNLWQVSPNIFD